MDAIIYLTEARQVTGEVLHVDGRAHRAGVGNPRAPSETSQRTATQGSFLLVWDLNRRAAQENTTGWAANLLRAHSTKGLQT